MGDVAMSTQPGPATRRRQLGRQLRELRQKAGIETIRAASDRSGLSTATISRIESANQAILPRNVRLLCQTYGVEALLIDRLAREAQESEEHGWLLAYGDAAPNWFKRYAAEEAEAAEIWEYETEFVPGLLQTADYCRAVTSAYKPDITKDELERLVTLRVARQGLLNRDRPPRLHTVINEAALRRQVGGPKVMRAQLGRLADVAKRPNITMQVLPFTAGAHPAMTGAFITLHFPAVSDPTIFVEFDSSALYPDRPADLDRYRWVFERLRKLALSPAKSIALVGKVEAEL
jgi:transcriptional regulator with XRE-family HTH domain